MLRKQNFDGQSIVRREDHIEINLKDYVSKRESWLKKIQGEKERALKNVLEGKLRTFQHGNGYQYYYRKNTADKNGEYIGKDNLQLAGTLAQQEYDSGVLDAVYKEMKVLDHLKRIEGRRAENIYERMPQGKKILIKPVRETDEQYIHRWLSETYTGLCFSEKDSEYYTADGLRVRSKSEVLIAELLDRMGVPYKYEKPLLLNNTYPVCPDFTLLDVCKRREIYYEHLGMIDKEDYRNANLKKIRKYEESGYYLGERLLVTLESQAYPIDIRLVEKKIRHILRI